MNRTSFPNRPAPFMYGIALTAAFLFLPLSISAQTPTGLPAEASAQAGYDNYLLATQKIGETLGESIKGGMENTKELYQNAWNELVFLTKDTTQTLPLYGAQSLATIADIWNTTTNYFSNLFNKQPIPTPAKSGVGTPTVSVGAQPQTPPKPAPIPTPAKSGVGTPTVSVGASPKPFVIQNTVERILSGVTAQDLEQKMEQLRNELVAKIGFVSGQSQSNYSNNFAAIALTNKIDQLTNTVITNPTITGATITGGSISGTAISGAISVSSGTFSGNLTVSGTGTSTFAGDSNFDSGTLYIDSLNNRVGVGTSSPSDTLALAGPLYFSQISAPSVTTNRLYNTGGSLYFNGTALGAGGGGTSSWATTTSQVSGQLVNYSLNTTDIVAIGSSSTTTAPFWFNPNNTTGYISGNLGIGTTSPYAKLSVVGETVSSYFTATSTTATTTLSGGLNVGSGRFAYNYSNGKILMNAPNAIQSALELTLHATGFAETTSGLKITGTDLGTISTAKGIILEINDVGAGASVGISMTGSSRNGIDITSTAGSAFKGVSVTNNSIDTSGNFFNAQSSSAGFPTGASMFRGLLTGGSTSGKFLKFETTDGAGNIFVVNTNGNVGIGTTSPYAKLSVVGETVSSYFTATSTTATSTFMGAFGIGTTTSATNNTLVVQGGVCITGGTTCPTVSAGSLRVDTAGSVADDPGDVFDVAERYPASEIMSAGEIAALDMATEDKAVVKKGTAGDVLIGIVSTRAAIAINGADLILAPAGEATSTKPLIALSGRVPVKVTTEGGIIKKGDKITASSIPGVGMKATKSSQQTVGIALASWSGESEGTVLVFVQTSPTRLDPAIAGGTILDGTGESSFWSVEEGTGRIKFISQGIDLNDQDIVSVRSIIGSAGKWSIDASGRLVVDEVQTNRLCVGDTCVTQDEFRKVFGGSQTAQVSVTPPLAETPTPSTSTPEVISDTTGTSTADVVPPPPPPPPPPTDTTASTTPPTPPADTATTSSSTL